MGTTRLRADWIRRMQKSLDQMNVRVHRAVSDIEGQTGMAIIRAIAKGERNPVELAKLRRPGCHKDEEEIAEQLSGHWREDHLFSLAQSLKMHDAVAERMEAYEKEILRRLGETEAADHRGQQPPPLKNANKSQDDPATRRRTDAPSFSNRLLATAKNLGDQLAPKPANP